MLKTDAVEKALDLLDLGYTYPSITDETGMPPEDVSAVGNAYLSGQTDQLFRELKLASVLELAVGRLRSGQGWDKGTTGDVLGEILHAYSEHVKKALGLALLSGKF